MHIIHICFLKNILLFFSISIIFCTFAVQKNIIYLCLKIQELMVVLSWRYATFRGCSRCLPG